jgi:serine/threonine protein kinase
VPTIKDNWSGTTLSGGRYRVTGHLGDGGMGSVYRAFDNSLETDVVIKTPRRSLLEDPAFARRFQVEIRSLVQLSHPHIVRIIDVGDHAGLPFAVMQFLGGGSIESRRERSSNGSIRPMAVDGLIEWLPDVAEALDFMHSQNFVHRDVKPANILFDAHSNVYLSDFGLAKAIAGASDLHRHTKLTGSGLVVGTPHYLAPELILDESCDGRADQYALAVTIHELLSGQMPIDAPTPAAVLVEQTRRSPTALIEHVPTIPAKLSAAVLRALSKKPEERFSSCVEFSAAVLATVDSERLRTRSPPVVYGRISHGPTARVPCPACQKIIRMTEKSRGKRTWCPGCKTPIEVSHDLLSIRELCNVTAKVGTGLTPDRSSCRSETRSIVTYEAGDSERQNESLPAELKDNYSTTTVSQAAAESLVCKPGNRSTRARRWGQRIGTLAFAVIVSAIAWTWYGRSQPTLIVDQTKTSESIAERTESFILADIPDQSVQFDEQFLHLIRAHNDSSSSLKYRLNEAPPTMRVDSRGVITWDASQDRTPGKYLVTIGVCTSVPVGPLVERSFVVTVVAPPQSAQLIPARTPPTVAIVRVDPNLPVAGQDISVYVTGEDVDGKPVRCEYRRTGEKDWLVAQDNRFTLASIPVGVLSLQLRSIDAVGTSSAIVTQTFKIEPLPRESAPAPATAMLTEPAKAKDAPMPDKSIPIPAKSLSALKFDVIWEKPAVMPVWEFELQLNEKEFSTANLRHNVERLFLVSVVGYRDIVNAKLTTFYAGVWLNTPAPTNFQVVSAHNNYPYPECPPTCTTIWANVFEGDDPTQSSIAYIVAPKPKTVSGVQHVTTSLRHFRDSNADLTAKGSRPIIISSDGAKFYTYWVNDGVAFEYSGAMTFQGCKDALRSVPEGWQPIWINAYPAPTTEVIFEAKERVNVKRGDRLYALICAKSVDSTPWATSVAITAAQLKDEMAQRKAQGYWPKVISAE